MRMNKIAVQSVALIAVGVAIAIGSSLSDEVLTPIKSAPFKKVMPGVEKAGLWGSPSGEHAVLTRMAAGFKAGMHTHKHEVRMVIIEGTILHTDAKGGVTQLTKGAYRMVPGEVKHDTACAAGQDCLFVESQPGPFDLKAAK